ncbi:MAG: alpha/beta fold hydrolase [Actinomycetota bacterium]
MKSNFFGKLLLVSLFVSAAFSCQSQSVSNSPDKTNSNISANNSANTNQTNSQTKIPEPQTVKFESAEKAEIVGTFYESPKANSPAVLLLHQWGNDRKSYDEFARRLQAKGFGVLAIDGRGFGDSTKTTDGKTIAPSRTNEAVKGMKADVAGAFDFLTKQKNVDAARIGIVGASYGSSLAMIYGAENPKVKALVLLSPGLNYFGNMPTEPAVKSYGTRPLLLVAADDDKESADAVKKLKASGANDKYEVQIYERGGHGTGLFAAKVGLGDFLEQFLTKSL